METPSLRCGGRTLTLEIPRIMGILNVTPDSFSDGGRFVGKDKALAHVDHMLQAGADIIDIGGESTRPGAAAVPLQEELDRVIPVLEAIKERFDTIVSVDTSKATVMREAAASGAGMLNDVRALCEEGALAEAAESGLPVCIMHMQGQPRTMQLEPVYDEVVAEVIDFFKGRLQAAESSGIDVNQICIDPGFGFGKTLCHNVELAQNLGKMAAIAPVLTGLSRKRMIAEMLGDHSLDRTMGSVVAALQCVQNGASIVRVHDVHAMAQALTIWQAMRTG